MRNSVFPILFVFCLTICGCGDFLEEYSKDQVYASSWEDLDEVLIGNGYIRHDSEIPTYDKRYYAWLFMIDDDAEELMTATTESQTGYIAEYRRIATWQKDPFFNAFTDGELTDNTVEMLYAHIAYVNTIINYLDEFPNDPIEEKRRICGEGQFLRAVYYLMLSNLYGWAYNPANGGSDLSVPLKTNEWVTEDKFSRATVGEVYDAIVNDLKGACENLRGVVQKNYYRTNQLASRILLSRVYLYMEDYDNVIAQCDSALVLGCPLSDLNAYNMDPDGYEDIDTYLANRDYLYNPANPEIVFTMGYALVQNFFAVLRISSSRNGSYSASASLIDEFQHNAQVEDLRLSCYFHPHETALDRYGVCKNRLFEVSESEYPTIFETFLIRTVEVYLNKAEAQAMKGDLAGAISTLQPLLETRYATGKLPSLTSLNEEDLVHFIRSERRRELCFEGHRWPDLKRYAVNTKYKDAIEISHAIYNFSGSMTGGIYGGRYVLGPYGTDEGWIMPLPSDEIEYNDGKLDNPERPDRNLSKN